MLSEVTSRYTIGWKNASYDAVSFWENPSYCNKTWVYGHNHLTESVISEEQNQTHSDISSTLKELSIKSLFLLVSLLIQCIMRWLKDNIRRKHQKNGVRLLHHDDTWSYTEFILQKSAKTKCQLLLTRLASVWFFLFPKMKIKLKSWRFNRKYSITRQSSGKGVYTLKGTTSKVMVLNKVQVQCDFQLLMNSRNFWIHLVIL